MSAPAATIVKLALTQFLKRVPTPQKALDAMAEELWDEVLQDAVQAVQRLEGRVGQTYEQLAARIDQTDAQLLALRLLDQATRSAGRARHRLMARAVAGVYEPNIDVEMKSRAERALEQLEPSDVRALRVICEEPTIVDCLVPSSTKGALLSAGCLSPVARAAWNHDEPIPDATASVPVSSAELTATARAVVAFVASWDDVAA